MESRIVLAAAVLGMLCGGCSGVHSGDNGPGVQRGSGVIASGVANVTQIDVPRANGGFGYATVVGVLCVSGVVYACGLVWLIWHHRKLARGLVSVTHRVMADKYVG